MFKREYELSVKKRSRLHFPKRWLIDHDSMTLVKDSSYLSPQTILGGRCNICKTNNVRPEYYRFTINEKTSLVSKLCSRCKKKSWSVFIIFARGGLCFIPTIDMSVPLRFFMSLSICSFYDIYSFQLTNSMSEGSERGASPPNFLTAKKWVFFTKELSRFVKPALGSVLGPPCLPSETQHHRRWLYFSTVP